jgi:hypothetical protein
MTSIIRQNSYATKVIGQHASVACQNRKPRKTVMPLQELGLKPRRLSRLKPAGMQFEWFALPVLKHGPN